MKLKVGDQFIPALWPESGIVTITRIEKRLVYHQRAMNNGTIYQWRTRQKVFEEDVRRGALVLIQSGAVQKC